MGSWGDCQGGECVSNERKRNWWAQEEGKRVLVKKEFLMIKIDFFFLNTVEKSILFSLILKK